MINYDISWRKYIFPKKCEKQRQILAIYAWSCDLRPFFDLRLIFNCVDWLYCKNLSQWWCCCWMDSPPKFKVQLLILFLILKYLLND
jgi:hypothetical protein